MTPTPERQKALISATSIIAVGDLWCGSECAPELARELIAAEAELVTAKDRITELESDQEFLIGPDRLNEILIVKDAELATLREALESNRVDAMIAHCWFSETFGEAYNGRDFSVKIPMARREVSALREEAKRLREALAEARCWMHGWGSGTPTIRGAKCETVYDAHQLIQKALVVALADPPHPILNEDEFPHGSVDTEPGFSLADSPCKPALDTNV